MLEILLPVLIFVTTTILSYYFFKHFIDKAYIETIYDKILDNKNSILNWKYTIKTTYNDKK